MNPISRPRQIILGALGALLFASASAALFTLLEESFSSDTYDTSETLATYPQWERIGTTPLTVSSGAIRIIPQGVENVNGQILGLQGFEVRESFFGKIEITYKTGRSNESGSYNTGILIGESNIVFHPGYSFGEGAFRVDRWINGARVSRTPNMPMGFTPATLVLHDVKITIDSYTGGITVLIVDGADPTRSFTYNFSDNSVTQPFEIALTTYGFLDEGIAYFDDVVIAADLIPESVGIDVKPGMEPDCGGSIPVAVLGSDSFDVAQIDPSTLAFQGLQIRQKGNQGLSCNFDDVNLDGYVDFVCRYENGLTQGKLSGRLLDGTFIEGTDAFCVKN